MKMRTVLFTDKDVECEGPCGEIFTIRTHFERPRIMCKDCYEVQNVKKEKKRVKLSVEQSLVEDGDDAV